MLGYGKAPSGAIAGFLVRPEGFFSGVSKARKTAPEKRLIGYVMRHFVVGFVAAAIWQPPRWMLWKVSPDCWQRNSARRP